MCVQLFAASSCAAAPTHWRSRRSVRPSLRATVTAALGAMWVLSAHAVDSLAHVRALIRATPENSWIKANTNSFSAAWPPANLRAMPNSSYSGPSAVIRAWSSFAWDNNRGDLLLFGGGHANYAGNEVYRWRGSTRQWERASMPSGIDPSDYMPIGGAQYAPQSSHTYDNAIYLPLSDRFVTFGGAAFQSGGAFALKEPNGTVRRTGPYFFDPTRADGNRVGGRTGSGVDPLMVGGEM